MRYSSLLLAVCALWTGCSEDDSLDHTGMFVPREVPVALPEALVEELSFGESRAIVVLDDRDIEADIARQRGARDRAGDGDELLARRALAWQTRAEDFMIALPDGARADRAYENFPALVLDLDDLDSAEQIASDPRVSYIFADEVYEHALSQSLAHIGQPAAASSGFTGAGTAVAVLDTGANYTVADLGSCTAPGTPSTCRVAYAADFAANDGSLDSNGHGTNVSSIVAAVAPGTDILALDVFASASAYSTDILSAIDWVIANKTLYNIASINMSLSGGSSTTSCVDVFSTGINNAKAAGVSVVVASGNNAYTNALGSPACNAGAFSVGAVYDANMGPMGWSGCTDWSSAADQVTCFSNSASFLDVLAPGAMITAGGYTMGGTSMASPHVAGAMAVLRAADGSATVDELETKVKETGVTITDSRNGLSFPRLDLASAVTDCITGISPSSIAPSAAGESGTITITASVGCEWDVGDDADWLTLTVASGSGSGSIGWTASANTGGARIATINLLGHTIPVSQSADPAPVGSISINGGAAATNSRSSTLTLSASDSSGIADMCISSSTTCTTFEAYSTTKSFTLPTGAGTKTVYATFRDNTGSSTTVSDTILVDTAKPTGGTIQLGSLDGGLSVSWSGFTDASSGVASYKVVYGTSAPASSCTSGTVAYQGSATSTSITGIPNGTSQTVRVCAIDAAGNISTGVTASGVAASESVPPTGTIVLDGGATYALDRTLDVTLSATDDSGVTHMCVGTSSSCTTFVPYSTATTVSVTTAAGTKTVYAVFKDSNGNVSTPVSDTILYDATKPTNGTATTAAGDGQLTVSWSGFADTTSGIASYKVVYATTTAPSTCTSGTTAYEGSSTSTTLTGLVNGTVYAFRVCAVDGAGNMSTGATVTGRPAPETTPPTGTVLANSGAAWTNSRTLSLAITGSDAAGVSRMCVSATSTCTSWKTFATSTTLTASTGDGTKTAYVWLEDGWGNVTTSPITDTIGVDTTKPTGGTATATATAGGASLSWSGFTDVTSGVASYKVVYQNSTAPSTCSAGTTAYTGTSTSTTLSGLTSGVTLGLRFCAIDTAGNTSTGITRTVTPL